VDSLIYSEENMVNQTMEKWIVIQNSEKNTLPEIGVPVLCRLQHWFTKNIREYVLKRVEEDDVSWRTCDDNSELSYDWNVIEWRKERTVKPMKKR
jgi:hypothetical protein